MKFGENWLQCAYNRVAQPTNVISIVFLFVIKLIIATPINRAIRMQRVLMIITGLVCVGKG